MGSMSVKKLPVAINIFPTLDSVELVQFDEKTGEIDKAGSVPCQFDLSTRQMQDPALMTQAIKDLLLMHRVPAGTPVVLVLPSFFTREIDLPAEFSNDELRFALISEAERFYIFKKSEPEIDWLTLSEGRLLYSAFPKSEIDKYIQIFRSQKIPLQGIELNYLSIMRGLVSTGVIAGDELTRSVHWCLMVISDTAMFISSQDGMRLLKATESLLSATVEDEQSALTEIQQDFEGFVAGESFEKIVLVNNSRTIDSSNIMSLLSSVGTISLIEQNAGSLASRGAEGATFPCSLEGVGGVFYKRFPEFPGMNFVGAKSDGLEDILQYRQKAMWILIGLNVGVLVLSLMIWGLMALLGMKLDMDLKNLTVEMSKQGTDASASQWIDISRKRFIKQSAAQNAVINNFLIRTGSTMPASTWLTGASVASQTPSSPLDVILQGNALTLDPVNQYLTTLNTDLANGLVLEVSGASPITSPDGQSYFSWTIQNKGAGTDKPAGGG